MQSKLRCGLFAAGISLALFGQGCSLLRAPGKAVQAITPGSKPAQKEPAEVAGLVQRFADEFSLRTGLALDEYAQLRGGVPEAASEVLHWKVAVLSVSLSIAGGPNPYANLVDMVALVSLNRNALEYHRTHSAHGDAFVPWLKASGILESNVWQLAAAVFHPGQVKELRKAVDLYLLEHTGAERPLFSSAQEFTSSLKLASAKSSDQMSLLGFVGLDASMGLDPAVQEVTRTRLFAERAMFTLQRMPALTRLQTEMLLDDLMRRPETRQTLTNITSLTDTADLISRTAASLPDRITEERKAILSALDEQQGKLTGLAAQLERTLSSGEKMSTSLNATLTTFDALMKRFGVGEPSTTSDPAPATNARPFDILDYARAAEEFSVTARELDVLLKDLGSTVNSPGWKERLQDVATVSRQVTADARSVLNRAFLLCAGLVLLAFGCALVYRRLNPRMPPGDREKA